MPPASAATLMQVQTELNLVRASTRELQLKIRTGELIRRDEFEAQLFVRARRIRDQLLTAPARHAAILAAEAGVAPGLLANALEQILRAELAEMAAKPPSPR